MNEETLGVVVTGGKIPSRRAVEHLLRRPFFVVAADSGVDNADRLGLPVDLAVGDFDSIENRELLSRLPPDRVKSYPRDKDYTDTELALVILRERGIMGSVVIGGGGGRLDHILALVSLFHGESPPALWVTHNAYVRRLDSEHSYEVEVGQTISFFPLGKGPCTMSSSGLKWPLDNLKWYPGDLGLSNEATEATVTVVVHSGALLMVQPFPPEGV